MEQNYSPTEREALVLKEGLVKFQLYEEGNVILAVTNHALYPGEKPSRMSIVGSPLGEQYLQLTQNSKLFTMPAEFILMSTQSQD